MDRRPTGDKSRLWSQPRKHRSRWKQWRTAEKWNEQWRQWRCTNRWNFGPSRNESVSWKRRKYWQRKFTDRIETETKTIRKKTRKISSFFEVFPKTFSWSSSETLSLNIFKQFFIFAKILIHRICLRKLAFIFFERPKELFRRQSQWTKLAPQCANISTMAFLTTTLYIFFRTLWTK